MEPREAAPGKVAMSRESGSKFVSEANIGSSGPALIPHAN